MTSRHRRWFRPAIAGASVLALSSPLTAVAATTPAAAPSTTAPLAAPQNVPPGTHSVTLITGDVVTTRQAPAPGQSGGTVVVTGPGGSPSRARIMESGGDLYVYPESVLPYLAQGTLDRRLFDVSDLVADGYDDAHRAALPLIVSYTAAPGLRAAAAPEGSALVRTLAGVQGAAVTEDRARSADFWSAVTGTPPGGNVRTALQKKAAFGGGIAHIWLDGKVTADLADTTAQIGAPQVWAGGDTGQGVDVAVLDTGVDTGHPDLVSRLTATKSFVPDEDVEDRNGHGTHVASTIAGTGAASGGKEKGVAPGAELHIGKVLSDAGSGQDSWVLAGMEWAAADQHAKVINMSLGSETPSDGTDPESEAVDRLSAQTGALFVVAAGNAGAPDSIGGPGAADAALTVGAVDATDNVAFFSSQGPRVGDGGLKPEITAPGVDVLAARSQYAPEGEGSYQTLSGTSMATPHVAGAAALLAAVHPELTGGQLKDLLASSSLRTPQYDSFQAGSGRVDAAAAVHARVFASATAYAGQVAAGATGAVQRPVTYTNTTGAPLTLALSVAAPGAPAGLFTLSAEKAVVPAHGSTAITVTIDGSAAGGNGRYSGQILATDTDGELAAHTAVSLGDVAHKLTMVLKDSHGNPVSGVVEVLKSGEYDPDFFLIDDSGTGSVFLPGSVYSVLAFKDVPGVHGPHSLGMALLGDPDVSLDQDATVLLDASKARRVEMTTPQKTEATYQRLEYNRSMGGASWRDYMETQTSYDSLWAQPMAGKVTHGDFYLAARWRKEQPALSVATSTTDFTDVLRQDSVTPLPEGRLKLPVVFAGNGASTDYAGLDVRGKAVVVRRNSAVTDVAQATAAAQAGARLLLVGNDQPGRQIRSYSADPFTPAPIDVALLSTDEGEKLIRQARARNARLTVDSQPVSPYVYDLMRTWHNEIPSDLVVRGSAKNLARVDETFDSPDPTLGGGEFRFDWPSYSDWGIGTTMREPVNERRTDWVSTGGAYQWGQEAYVDGLLYEIEPRTSYRPGSSQDQEWFKPIERPFLNNNYKAPTRSGSWLSMDVPGYGGDDHVGMSMDYQRTQQTLTLYQGDTQLGRGTGTVVGGTAPGAGKLPYRLVIQNSRDASVSTYSATTSTEWTFSSAAPRQPDAQDVLPLLQLDYGISTDTGGRAARNTALSVSAAQLPGAVGAGRIGAVTVELSYDDGRTWQKSTAGHDGEFRLDAPRRASFVSLRASVRDAAGNGVTQTVIRAFGLR
ncbi:S8 family serine peptidase [Streptomyces sp. NBC_01476]|uniref:S8 family peptidase n=1 Tax=Streptomyces sp. NBC_01476 TaxID=2903881 RepID=UPI002E31C0A4|nr:S8 family serine peptidase [Streptomyces sp. NBC_01476]